MKKSSIGVVFILAVFLTPFLAYGLSSFVGFYDGFIVTSGSMEPEIKTGSLLFTVEKSAGDIKEGDTITFEDGDSVTTHEVIEKNYSNGTITFRTKGIANDSPDAGSVTEEELIGSKLISLPYLGYLMAWGSTSTGYILLVVIPGSLLLIMELGRIVSEALESPAS